MKSEVKNTEKREKIHIKKQQGVEVLRENVSEELKQRRRSVVNQKKKVVSGTQKIRKNKFPVVISSRQISRKGRQFAKNTQNTLSLADPDKVSSEHIMEEIGSKYIDTGRRMLSMGIRIEKASVKRQEKEIIKGYGEQGVNTKTSTLKKMEQRMARPDLQSDVVEKGYLKRQKKLKEKIEETRKQQRELSRSRENKGRRVQAEKRIRSNEKPNMKLSTVERKSDSREWSCLEKSLGIRRQDLAGSQVEGRGKIATKLSVSNLGETNIGKYGEESGLISLSQNPSFFPVKNPIENLTNVDFFHGEQVTRGLSNIKLKNQILFYQKQKQGTGNILEMVMRKVSSASGRVVVHSGKTASFPGWIITAVGAVVTVLLCAFLFFCVCLLAITGASEGGEVDSPGSSVPGEGVVAFAMRYVGNPYVYGGNSLTKGIDCSHFVYQCFSHCGYKVEYRTSKEIPTYGENIGTDLAQAVPGNLLVFTKKGQGATGIHHVAIYAGDGMMVHAWNSKDGIVYNEVLAELGGSDIYCIVDYSKFAGTVPTGTADTKKIWNFLKKNYRLDDMTIAVIMGNLYQESGFNPHCGEGGSHVGIVQWSNPGRFDNLKKYAKKKKEDYWDVTCQLDFMMHELKSAEYQDVLKYCKKCTHLEYQSEKEPGSVWYFARWYEICISADGKYGIQNYDRRYEAAVTYYQQNT